MQKGNLGRAIRFAIRSHEDHDLLPMAVSCGEKISFRLSPGILDYRFEQEVA